MQNIPQSTLTAIVALLKPYCPEISETDVLTAVAGVNKPEAPEEAQQLLTKKEAAAKLKVSLSTVNNYIKAGYLRAVKIGAGKRLVRITTDSIDAMLRA